MRGCLIQQERGAQQWGLFILLAHKWSGKIGKQLIKLGESPKSLWIVNMGLGTFLTSYELYWAFRYFFFIIIQEDLLTAGFGIMLS